MSGFALSRPYRIVNTVIRYVPNAETVSIIWEEVREISFLPPCQFEQFSDKAPIVQCETCEVDYCYKDKIVWSANHDCVEYGHADSKLSANVKKCPTCFSRVSYFILIPPLCIAC